MSVDIESAYLECDMEGEPVYMMLCSVYYAVNMQVRQHRKNHDTN